MMHCMVQVKNLIKAIRNADPAHKHKQTLLVVVPSIGGCRTQDEPGHAWWIINIETFILWPKFDNLSHIFIIHVGSKVYPDFVHVCPGLLPPMVPSHAFRASSLGGLLDLNEKVQDFKF